jgi:hypothetical protein
MALFLILAAVTTFFPKIQLFPVNLLLSALSLLSFVIHEAGHIVFGLLGTFIGVLGGTLAQLLFPATVGALAWYRRRRVTAMFFAFWIGQGLTEIARYIGDARSQQLQLFSPQTAFGGGSPLHDWNYLLGTLHLLSFDQIIAGLVTGLGILVMLAAILYCLKVAIGINLRVTG